MSEEAPSEEAPAAASWRFSDGTVVSVGGVILGDSLFAQELRAELAHGDTLIPKGAHPGDSVRLDVDNVAHLDRFLRREMAAPYRRETRLRLLEAPSGLEPFGAPDDDDSDADDSDSDDDVH